MKYEINNIYNVDCFQALKQLPDKSIDCIYTDPPYEYSYDKKRKVTEEDFELYQQNNQEDNKRMNTSFKVIGHEIKNITSSFDIATFIKECFRVMKTPNIYIWCSNDQIANIYNELKKYGVNPKVLVWVKTNSMMLSKGWSSNIEFCLTAQKGGVWNNLQDIIQGYSYKHYISTTNSKDKKLYSHPTIKPMEIVKRHLLYTTKENDIILDPFLGSGTTCAVAKEINRQYLGFELDKKWYKIAKDRIAGVQLFKGEKQMTIFDMEDLE